MSVAFSPDGHRIASGGYDNTVRIWDADTGQLIGNPLAGHTDDVMSVAFSPDGHRITSASVDGTVRIWNADTGNAIGIPLAGHTGPVHVAAFSPDGLRIASGGDDSTLRLWPASAALPEILCDKLTANMSQRQWDEWISPNIYYVEACPGLPISSD